MNDSGLVQAARAGDREAFAALWRLHYPRALVVARSVAPPAVAEDTVSEAFIRVYRLLRNGNGPADDAFRPYLHQVVRSVAAQQWRTNGRHTDDTELESMPADGPHPETAVESDYMKSAFKSLPDTWRQALWMHEVEGMRTGDIAATLGIKSNAAAQLIVRARAGLKRAWLQAHVNRRGAAPACVAVLERLGAYVDGGAGARDIKRIEAHIATCSSCTEALGEARRIRRGIAVVLIPFGGAVPAFASIPGTSDTSPSARSSGMRTLTAVGSIAAGAVLAVTTAAFAVATIEGQAHESQAAPVFQDPPDVGPVPDLPTRPVSEERPVPPTSDTEPVEQPPVERPPVAPVEQPPAAAPPAECTAGNLAPEWAFPVLGGEAEPSATVTITAQGSPVADATADASGLWRSGPLGPDSTTYEVVAGGVTCATVDVGILSLPGLVVDFLTVYDTGGGNLAALVRTEVPAGMTGTISFHGAPETYSLIEGVNDHAYPVSGPVTGAVISLADENGTEWVAAVAVPQL